MYLGGARSQIIFLRRERERGDVSSKKKQQGKGFSVIVATAGHRHWQNSAKRLEKGASRITKSRLCLSVKNLIWSIS